LGPAPALRRLHPRRAGARGRMTPPRPGKSPSTRTRDRGPGEPGPGQTRHEPDARNAATAVGGHAPPTTTVQIGALRIGGGQPLALIGGPCAIENEKHALVTAERIVTITTDRRVPFIYKSSYDKANRSSIHGHRGPGLTEGLRILKKVRDTLGVPVLSDVHQVSEVAPAAEVLDVLQIPAFLCRAAPGIAPQASGSTSPRSPGRRSPSGSTRSSWRCTRIPTGRSRTGGRCPTGRTCCASAICRGSWTRSPRSPRRSRQPRGRPWNEEPHEQRSRPAPPHRPPMTWPPRRRSARTLPPLDP